MIKIELPEFTTITYETVSDIPYNVSGLYCFYNAEHELLYVGKATELKQRLQGHFSGGSQDNNTSRIYHLFEYAKIFFEECPLNRDLYETYMINTLEPFYNKQKCILYKSKFYDLPRYPRKQNKWEKGEITKTRCTSVTKQGEQCKCIALDGSDKCRIHSKTN